MNQNTSVDSDLQKAIDDITKSTSGDPLFADPVAAPAMPPMPTNVGPFPIATPAPMPTGMPQIPSPNLTPEPARMSNPATLNTPAPEITAPEPVMNAPMMNEPMMGAPVAENLPAPEPIAPAEPVSTPALDEPTAPAMPEPTVSESTEPTTPEATSSVAPFEREGNLDIKDVKEAALRELAPLLAKLDVPAEQKFDIYKNVIDTYHDSSVIASAYRAASEIEDERTRGEALLYIINSIDKM